MAYKRQNPKAAQQARAGNYTAQVDSTGMDPSMKATLGLNKPLKKRMGFMEKLKSVFKPKS